jgi:hypothetical protein
MSVALLVAGTVIYLIWNTAWAWWLYGFAAIPFVLLVVARPSNEADARNTDFTDGPWSPP